MPSRRSMSRRARWPTCGRPCGSSAKRASPRGLRVQSRRRKPRRRRPLRGRPPCQSRLLGQDGGLLGEIVPADDGDDEEYEKLRYVGMACGEALAIGKPYELHSPGLVDSIAAARPATRRLSRPGSSVISNPSAYSTSTSMLTTTNAVTSTSEIPCTTARSFDSAALRSG